MPNILVIYIFCALFSLELNAQDSTLYGIFPMQQGKVCYEKIFNVDSTSKDEIIKRATNWALKEFVSQKDANQIIDKDAGILAYNFNFVISTGRSWQNMRIFVKNEKAKVIITDFVFKTPFVVVGSTSVPATSTNLEEWKKEKVDNIPKSIFLSKNYKERVWKEHIVLMNQINDQTLAILSSLQKALTSKKSDFDF